MPTRQQRPQGECEALQSRYAEGERDFTEADLQKANLGGVGLEGANLYKANLAGAFLMRADLRGANLREANLQGAMLRNADLENACLEIADLSKADFIGANLKNASLKEANLEGARMVGAHFLPAEELDQLYGGDDCRFTGADLSGANLKNADFLGAELLGAKIRNANLRTANLYDANLWKADLRNARLLGANLGIAKLIDAELSGANLMGANVAEAYLTFANVAHANLWGAHLYRCNLQRANLWGANLEMADLTGANLEEANLAGANLASANLESANLMRANLRRANLSGANMTGARLGEAICAGTTFADVDLSAVEEVASLATVTHLGPSSVGTDTLRRSRGMVPEAFLRGCGLGDLEVALSRMYGAEADGEAAGAVRHEVERLRSAAGKRGPVTLVSFAEPDAETAARLQEALQRRGVRCWLDGKPGEPVVDPYDTIDRIVRKWDAMVLCASRHSLYGCWWLDEEMTLVLNREELLRRRGGDGAPAMVVLDLDGFVRSEALDSRWRGELQPRVAAALGDGAADGEMEERGVEQLVEAIYRSYSDRG
jgi:uncharacterized protein YjbI with pentapeptide repeats